ncbi:hypothetical protein XBP1_330059 [Xenorhabdus bovienii str. puntauvense]|uniref:Uncharacterized protein n=2 Tax=Xenorhabdus bovienii TaxID=40576 RepID=A0A077N8L8_XENBV|nr:hypothetical protein XBFFR1_2050098 [Xenorhabdus bovienii str. feltiae France]CDG98551.1 hypothetical protein XBP1_330059 [Xenorhabdus bovienii str. puntauvense]CDH01462.1 hypothetical protein XBFM1_2190004 [Xenorhabdus bovienii str. feltiae Moldova]
MQLETHLIYMNESEWIEMGLAEKHETHEQRAHYLYKDPGQRPLPNFAVNIHCDTNLSKQ